MTYREITKIDKDFAVWSSQQNHRHSLLFSNCLNESQENNTRIEIKVDGYVDKNNFECKDKCVVIRAGLGRGKTQAMHDNSYQ